MKPTGRAVQESAVPVTEHGVLRDDAKGYVESVTPGEALGRLSGCGLK